jgi:adenylosuccinate lyase
VIARYTLPKMGAIWTEKNKFRKWLEVEIAVCEVQADIGLIPWEAVKEIQEKSDFKIERILEIEDEVKHDVIAFLTNVAEYVGESSRYIHLGMTSSDLLDTANALLMKEAGEILLTDLHQLQHELKSKAIEHKDTACIGRSHGIHAEPTTFGLKMALWYDEVNRHISRLERAIETISYGKVSGAVGTFAHLDPVIEEKVCQKLNLKPAPVSTQIIQRDRYAEYLSTIALVGCSLEKFATEVRNLQRTEILEAEEYFSKGQKGSSSMPHKRNPIVTEQISGLARLLRANAQAAMENVTLWHERDISHSSVERVIIPDSTILLNYMLSKFTKLVKNLLVYPENMKINLNKTNGLIFSQSVLLSLTQKGISRETAYRLVQTCAMESWQTKKDFKQLLMKNKEIKEFLSDREISDMFDLKVQLRNVDKIFERVGIS